MVKHTSASAIIALLVSFLFTGKSSAQLPVPEIYSISAPVIEAGKPTEISLNGANLEELADLTFSTPGFTSKPAHIPKTEFRLTPVQNGKKFIVTAPATTTKTTVEVRASGFFGLSTSRPLVILPAGEEPLSDNAGGAHHEIETAPELARETLAHGRTDADQTDWWKLVLKKGERILVHCEAERLESQADTSLKLVDERGFELEADRDTIGRDPMLDFVAPAGGNYWVGVHDIFYRGGVNYPYTLKASVAPWIDAVIPAAGKPGSTYKATLIGRNLPGGSRGENLSLNGKPLETLSVTISVPDKAPATEFSTATPATALLPGFTYRHGKSNPVKLGFTNLPVVITSETDIPPVLTVPSEASARFDSKGDSDQFEFDAKKGTAYWMEIIGDRLESRSDPYLLVEQITLDKEGKESVKKLRESDDRPNLGGNTFHNGSRDTSVGFTASADGKYRITVINQFQRGSAVNTYRLQLREAKPDFEVIAVSERPYLEQRQAFPSAALLRKGGTVPLRLLVYRHDGFTGPITVTASNLPEGVSCPTVILQNLETSAHLVLAATEKAPHWNGNIHVSASAKIGETTITHEVRAGTIVLGNNDYNLARIKTRLSPKFPLAVSASEATPVRVEAANSEKLSVTLGKKLVIPIKLISKHELKGNLVITPIGLYGLKKPPVVSIKEGQSEGTLNISFAPKTNTFAPRAGTWNFVLKATGVTKYKRNPAAAERARKELNHIQSLSKKYAAESNKAKQLVETKMKALATATANLATATADTKPAVEKLDNEAKADLAAAEKQFTSAEANRTRAEKALAAAKARSAALTKSAAPKDVKFASWSLPLSVEVLPEEKKK